MRHALLDLNPQLNVRGWETSLLYLLDTLEDIQAVSDEMNSFVVRLEALEEGMAVTMEIRMRLCYSLLPGASVNSTSAR